MYNITKIRFFFSKSTFSFSLLTLHWFHLRRVLHGNIYVIDCSYMTVQWSLILFTEVFMRLISSLTLVLSHSILYIHRAFWKSTSKITKL